MQTTPSNTQVFKTRKTNNHKHDISFFLYFQPTNESHIMFYCLDVFKGLKRQNAFVEETKGKSNKKYRISSKQTEWRVKRSCSKTRYWVSVHGARTHWESMRASMCTKKRKKCMGTRKRGCTQTTGCEINGQHVNRSAHHGVDQQNLKIEILFFFTWVT